MKFSMIAAIAAVAAAPLVASLGGCSLLSYDVDDDRHHAYYYQDRYQRDYYQRPHYRRPVVVAPSHTYVAPVPRHIPRHDHVIVQPNGRRVYVRDY